MTAALEKANMAVISQKEVVVTSECYKKDAVPGKYSEKSLLTINFEGW